MSGRAAILADALSNLPDLSALVAERARRRFHSFLIDFAWPVLQPGREFKDNWHIGAMCEHLEAVQSGQIKRLVVNLPFRSLKSTLFSQAYPSWDWINNPSRQHLTVSYARDIATRDAVASRNIINSPKYQQAFGDKFKLVGDQNVKTRYDNDQRGTRTITSTDSAATGFGGDLICIDDPISARDADSEVAREKAVEFWRGTTATRLNDPSTGAIVLVHQRLHEQDLTGYILAEEKGWDHLILPMRRDTKIFSVSTLKFRDPRKEGELLFPSRLDEETVAKMETTLGAYHTAAQLQQAPSSRGGAVFLRGMWQFWKVLPEGIEDVVISVDCTFKDLQTSDYVAIQAWGRKGANKYLLYRRKERLGFAATCKAIEAVTALYPYRLAVLVEDKANGSAVIETLTATIPGMIPINPEGGKVARAYAMQPEQEAGNIYLPDPSVDPDIETFLGEVSSFPGVAHDDETDAMTQAVNWYRTRERSLGLLGYYSQQHAAQQAERDRLRAEKEAA